jgi:hypothetical protein
LSTLQDNIRDDAHVFKPFLSQTQEHHNTRGAKMVAALWEPNKNK